MSLSAAKANDPKLEMAARAKAKIFDFIFLNPWGEQG
jgi:hypothetical protein